MGISWGGRAPERRQAERVNAQISDHVRFEADWPANTAFPEWYASLPEVQETAEDAKPGHGVHCYVVGEPEGSEMEFDVLVCGWPDQH